MSSAENFTQIAKRLQLLSWCSIEVYRLCCVGDIVHICPIHWVSRYKFWPIFVVESKFKFNHFYTHLYICFVHRIPNVVILLGFVLMLSKWNDFLYSKKCFCFLILLKVLHMYMFQAQGLCAVYKRQRPRSVEHTCRLIKTLSSLIILQYTLINIAPDNPFMLSGLFYYNSLDWSIFNSRVSGFYYNCFAEISLYNANSVDPDQMLHSVLSDLGLFCLPVACLWGFLTNGLRVLLFSSKNILTCYFSEKKNMFWSLIRIANMALLMCIHNLCFCGEMRKIANNPKYWDRIHWDQSKQCRPRSDAAFCGIWSGSTLFAQVSKSSVPILRHLIRVHSICQLSSNFQTDQQVNGHVQILGQVW